MCEVPSLGSGHTEAHHVFISSFLGMGSPPVPPSTSTGMPLPSLLSCQLKFPAEAPQTYRCFQSRSLESVPDSPEHFVPRLRELPGRGTLATGSGRRKGAKQAFSSFV